MRRLLLVEDNPDDARWLEERLDEQGGPHTDVTHVVSMRAAEEHLAEHPMELILLDLGLPDAQGLGAVQRAHAAAPRVPLVVLTGLDDESVAARALQEGAQDYLIKGQIDARGLRRALRYAVERKAMEEALLAEKERAQVTLGCIGEAVASTDVAGDITFMNPVAEQMTGWSEPEAVGRAMSEVFPILDATSREAMLDPADVVGGCGIGPPRSNLILLRRDGLEIPIEESVAAIRDREGRTTGAVTVIRDVSAAREMALQMTHAAQHDFLTGLPNRMLLDDRIRQAIALAARRRRIVGVLFLDVDGFKQINDSLGHPVGDRLLQSIATRLVGCLRDSDTVSRPGGDEFVVLLSEVEHVGDVVTMATRLLRTVAEPHTVGRRELHVTASVGVSVFPDDGHDAETLITNADAAMYQAKAEGRKRYRFFRPELSAGVV